MRRAAFLVLLLPWLLCGHGAPRRHAGEERVLSAVSLVDATSSPASRADDSRELVRSFVAGRRHFKLPIGHSSPLDVAPPSVAPRALLLACERVVVHAPPRALRPRRLTIPHNANAPPLRQS